MGKVEAHPMMRKQRHIEYKCLRFVLRAVLAGGVMVQSKCASCDVL